MSLGSGESGIGMHCKIISIENPRLIRRPELTPNPQENIHTTLETFETEFELYDQPSYGPQSTFRSGP